MTRALTDALPPPRSAFLALPLGFIASFVLPAATCWGGRFSDASAELEAAIDDAPDDPELALMVEAELASFSQYDPDAAESGWFERLQRAAGEISGDTPAERAALANLSWGMLGRGPASRAAEVARRALGEGKLLEEQGPESVSAKSSDI